jgi:hypothetical protein
MNGERFAPFQEKAARLEVCDFPVPSQDVTNQLSLFGNNLIIPGQGEFGLFSGLVRF